MKISEMQHEVNYSMSPDEKIAWRVSSCGVFTAMNRNPQTGKLSFNPIFCRNHRLCMRCRNARRCTIQAQLKDAAKQGEIFAVEFTDDSDKKFIRQLRRNKQAYRRLPYAVKVNGEAFHRIMVLFQGDGTEHGECYEANFLLQADSVMEKLVNTPEGHAISGRLGVSKKVQLNSSPDEQLGVVHVQTHYANLDTEEIAAVDDQLLIEVGKMSFETVQDALDWLSWRLEERCAELGLELHRNRVETRKVDANAVYWCHILAKRNHKNKIEEKHHMICPNCKVKVPIELQIDMQIA